MTYDALFLFGWSQMFPLDYFCSPDTLGISPGLEVHSVRYRTQGGRISPNKYDSTLLLNVSLTSR